MAARLLAGTPASPDIAFGQCWRRPDTVRAGSRVAWEDHERERDTALDALRRASESLTELAAGMPADEAEIVRSGILMAEDPALRSAIEEATMTRGLTAADAILEATGLHADAIASLGDELLAARADDVRSIGRRAARLTTGERDQEPPGEDLILIANDLGPADVAELAPALAGIALAEGGATAHAAIVARSLGIPMVTGLGRELLGVSDGTPVALDGTAGVVTIGPAEADALAAGERMHSRRLGQRATREERDRPAVTLDGRRITVLANVVTRAELELALDAGAEGVGLLRTELSFMASADWPSEQEHTNALEPVLAALGGRPAVVRVLDFGADKSPPFLAGVRERGIELLLAHEDALIAQLRAIVSCAHGRDIRILLPMIESAGQVLTVRGLVGRVLDQLGATQVPLGVMIETPLAAERADDLARVSDFLSIGTNDLTAATLGVDRFAVNAGRAHDPRVLRRIARSVVAAHRAGCKIEVCGEAASEPLMVPLLIGLGVDELSVGAARVGDVRRWIRQLSAGRAEALAQRALEMESAEQVDRAVAELGSAEVGDRSRESLERSSGVHALGG